MNEEMSRAAIVCDAIGTFYEDKEFMEKFNGMGVFKAVGILLRKYPDVCESMICAYEGTTPENSGINHKNVFGKLIKILTDKEILEVFQPTAE